MPARYVDNVLPDLQRWRQAGERTALVTLVAVDGSAPRPLGSQMAINASGAAVGNITGGCAEAAIVAEACAAMAAGQNRCVRYGTGSPYLDIKLPCGSGIDVYFDVTLSGTALDLLLTAQRAREPMVLAIDPAAHRVAVAPEPPAAEPGSSVFTRRYTPAPRLVLAGAGPMVPILAAMASIAEFEVIVMSSEPETLALAVPHAVMALQLTTPDEFRYDGFDRWTAFVSLFHEHDWEPPILTHALASACYYIGALGSRRTHATRLALLRERGVDETLLARIHGPVGLDLGARSPPEIAVSILAEIIATRQRGRQAGQ